MQPQAAGETSHNSVDTLSVGNYRSLHDIWLPLANLTVVTGANGAGKSNLFRALNLLKAAASGRFAETLAREGGMPGALFAGPRPTAPRVELRLGVAFSDLRYELIAGLPIKDSFDSRGLFMRDPDIKAELLWTGKRRPSATLMERKNSQLWGHAEGVKLHYELPLEATQSALAQVLDAKRFPQLAILRARINQIRLYQEFRCDAASPVRAPHVGYRATALEDDGSNLAAAIGTILMSGDAEAFRAAVENAFPDASLEVDADERGIFHLQFRHAGLLRALSAAELSDGTLRYLCLLAALFATRPATLLAFNEPEASLHPSLLRPLARQMANASQSCQVLVITHSEILANALEDFSDAKQITLSRVGGMTQIVGQNVLNRPNF
jgi:predicted ATPase